MASLRHRLICSYVPNAPIDIPVICKMLQSNASVEKLRSLSGIPQPEELKVRLLDGMILLPMTFREKKILHKNRLLPSESIYYTMTCPHVHLCKLRLIEYGNKICTLPGTRYSALRLEISTWNVKNDDTVRRCRLKIRIHH